MRIGWFGLLLEPGTDDGDTERFGSTCSRDRPSRWRFSRWPAWAALLPPPESIDIGRVARVSRRAGGGARDTMEWIPLLFCAPYPETPDVTVSSLLRDPVDGSRWAYGSGAGSHGVLCELTDEEAAAIEAEGFPSVYTYAIDADGRIWTSA